MLRNTRLATLALGLAESVFGLFLAALSTTARAASLPDPAIDVTASGKRQTAVFAGGCFWCTEAVFEQLAGVHGVISGYSGGEKRDATYPQVSSGATNHAEAIQINFDPAKITYGQLLKVFFSVAHDPTTLNYQGPDHGRQYRSAIFYADEEQKRVADAYIKQLDEAKVFHHRIVTEVKELKAFYVAEEYHQDFVVRNPSHGYVVVNALPKISKVKKEFPTLVKKK
ncbi:MAG: peptide-methionine (S)-S-oxide reductase [Bryobacterales bacterium]|nr:peptide-methionine (S)-S-oxide reductase [Bryobacterales bacterium]